MLFIHSLQQCFILGFAVHPLLLQSTHCYIDDVIESETPLLARAISSALSSCVVAVSHSKLLHLETLLLNQVLSFNPFNFLLAVDLWCTLFRWGFLQLLIVIGKKYFYIWSKQIFHYFCWITPKHVTSLRDPSLHCCARAAQLHSKKCRSGGEPLAKVCPIWLARDSNLSSPAPEVNALPLDQLAGHFYELSFFNFQDNFERSSLSLHRVFYHNFDAFFVSKLRFKFDSSPVGGAIDSNF